MFEDQETPRLFLASMSGRSRCEWAETRDDHVDGAFLGGFNIDLETLQAAKAMSERGRNEFLPEDPFVFLEAEIEQSSSLDLTLGANVRAVQPDPIHQAGQLMNQFECMLEINAHCRQPEMVEIGCGQRLLMDPPRLKDYILAAKESGVTVGVKGRFEVEKTDSPSVLNRCTEWGADFLHVDCMDSRNLLNQLEAPFLIANNLVRGPDDVRQYQQLGADAVSVGRANEPESLKFIYRAVQKQFDPVQTDLDPVT